MTLMLKVATPIQRDQFHLETVIATMVWRIIAFYLAVKVNLEAQVTLWYQLCPKLKPSTSTCPKKLLRPYQGTSSE